LAFPGWQAVRQARHLGRSSHGPGYLNGVSYFHNFVLSFNCGWSLALEAWCLELAACSL